MSKARRTLGMMLAMCVGMGACSTESAVQREDNPATGVNGGDDEDAGSTGSGDNTTGDTNPGSNGGADGGAASNGATAGDSTSGGATAGDSASGGATAGDSTSGGATAGGSGGDPSACMKGPTKGSSVLVIGDSYVAPWDGADFGKELQRLAKAAGALAASDNYANRAVAGTQMVGGFIRPTIPTQYANENNSDGHVKTVVMDGGGNDILVGKRECITTSAPPENKNCVDTINSATAAAKTLLAKMAADGVEDVVYFFYPHLPGGRGTSKELTNQTIDYALPVVKKACDDAPLNCFFVDTRGLFGTTTDDFRGDAIHPTPVNSNKIAAAVWKKMQAECIAQ